MSSIPRGTRPCIVFNVIALNSRKFDTVNLISFIVVFGTPHEMFVTHFSGPHTAEKLWPNACNLPCSGEGSPLRAAGHRTCNCHCWLRNACSDSHVGPYQRRLH
jgi:hypothetical protein